MLQFETLQYFYCQSLQGVVDVFLLMSHGSCPPSPSLVLVLSTKMKYALLK